MGGKYSSPAIDAEDLLSCLQDLMRDTGTKARIIIEEKAPQELTIRVESFTESNHVRVGVANETTRWRYGDGKLLAKALVALHKVYHKSYRLAHMPPQN